jgi:hypothetical protein
LEILGFCIAGRLMRPTSHAANQSSAQRRLAACRFVLPALPRQNYITCEGAEWQRKRAQQNPLFRGSQTRFPRKLARQEQGVSFANTALECIVHCKKNKGRELPEANA